MRFQSLRIVNPYRSPAALAPLTWLGWTEPKLRHTTVSAITGPIELLADRRLIVVADVENLSVSARKAGFKVSFAALADLLRQAAPTTELHAFFSRRPGDSSWERYFEERGWQAHARDIEVVQTCRGTEKLANADNLIAFHAGRLAAETDADMLIASGDGALVCDIARAVSTLPKRRCVFSLGFPGATSARLHRSQFIAGNLLVGQDCLRRNGTDRRR